MERGPAPCRGAAVRRGAAAACELPLGSELRASDMNVIYHYDAGPWLSGRLIELATRHGLTVTTCREDDDAGFAALLPAAEVLLPNLCPVTAAIGRASCRERVCQ